MMHGLKKSLFGVFGIFVILSSYYFARIYIEERNIHDPERIKNEIGYGFPDGTKIEDVSASIFSIADGANYQWVIRSEKSLMDWANSIGSIEYDKTWKIIAKINGRVETSYITIKNNGHTALIETFRP